MSARYGGSTINKGSSSSGGFLFGLALFLASFPVLFLNEGNAVKTARALDEGKGAVVSLPFASVDPANEGKLVYFSGSAVTDDELVDGYTGLRTHAIKLHRIAEMYQWKETTKKNEDRTEYYYDKAWSENHMNSDHYHNKSYSNPASMRVKGERYAAANVFVNEFRLSPNLIESISTHEPLPVTDEMYGSFSDSLRGGALLYNGGLYLGRSPQEPQIGDIRVSYRIYPEQEVSVVAMQQNGRAVEYTTSNGKTLEILYSGFRTADQIFAAEHKKNVIFTWIIRGAGVLVMYLGLMMSVGQLARLFSWIPLLGSVVAGGMALMAGLMSLSLSFIVISVAWIFYRPLLGIGLLAAAGLLLAVILKKSPGGETGTADQPPPLPVD